jgi:hypothetical protein
MRYSVFAAIILTGLIFSASVLAKGELQLDVSKPDVTNQETLIIKAIKTDKNYAEISDSDRQKITEGFNRIRERLSGVTFNELAEAEKTQLLSEQDVINKSLSRAASDSRLICKHEAEIGSNMKKRVCQTQAAKNRQAAAVREAGEPKQTN